MATRQQIEEELHLELMKFHYRELKPLKNKEDCGTPLSTLEKAKTIVHLDTARFHLDKAGQKGVDFRRDAANARATAAAAASALHHQSSSSSGPGGGVSQQQQQQAGGYSHPHQHPPQQAPLIVINNPGPALYNPININQLLEFSSTSASIVPPPPPLKHY